MSKRNGTIRLDRLLSNRGYCSRRDVRFLVKNGDIFIGDVPASAADQHVDPVLVNVRGEPLDPGEGMAILLHKPTGFVCSHRDKGRLIYELLPERFGKRNPALSSVGRLDKETSGLLILTDDGDLNHRLTSPNKKVGKTYSVTIDRELRGDEAQIFASGTLVLEGETSALRPAQWTALDANSGTLTIFEGRYHQIRRMFEALGATVTKLHRDSIGTLTLGSLECGEWRFLDDGEISDLLGPSASDRVNRDSTLFEKLD